MKILVSNDDGVDAPGINILAHTLKSIAEVTVFAPDRNRSGASNSLTLDNPIRVKQLSNGFHSVAGTPTDCVHLATTGLMSEQPDLVVSGINDGANLGDDIWYSGTVAAAIEGRFLGLPAIAVSLVANGNGFEFVHYQTAATVAKNLVLRLKDDPLPSHTILNVNVPDIPLNEVKGYMVTRLGSRHKAENVIKASDQRGQDIYWIGPPGPEADFGQGTDFFAVSNRYIAITPILLDLTHYRSFDQLSNWTNGLLL